MGSLCSLVVSASSFSELFGEGLAQPVVIGGGGGVVES